MKSKSQLFSSTVNSRAAKIKEVNSRIINVFVNQLNFQKGGIMKMAKKLALFCIVSIFMLTLTGASYAAQWANPGLLVTPETVKANAEKADWVILDCRDIKYYAKGHIPGAISFGKECKKALRDPSARAFKDISKYENLLGKAGIGNDTNVIIYGEHKITDSFKDTTVAFWVLEYLGHDKAHVLNGGIDAWEKAGLKLTNTPTIKPAKTFKAKVVKNRIATTEEVLQIAKGTKNIPLIDARSKKEHEGEDIRALRGGYIPKTTASIPHTDTMDQVKDPKTGKDVDTGYLSPDRVAGFYKNFDKNKRTIAYCQTGTRSTLTYLELRLLGFKDPANYDDSWIIWGNNPAKYPVENEQWINFERLKKVEEETKQLKESMPKKEKAE
jgi:thiosulfate/3-mercaptopyruvate sulfurtransferase